MSDPCEVGKHIRLHMPSTCEPAENTLRSSEVVKEAEYTRHVFHTTPQDECKIPAGIASSSVMILRNLARYADRQRKQGGQAAQAGLMTILFGHVKAELWNAVAVHRTLTLYLYDLMKTIGIMEIMDHGDAMKAVNETQQDEVMG